MSLRTLLRWLAYGSDEQYLPPSWLANTARLQGYVQWTELQRESARIVKDTQATARERFWQQVEAQRVAPRVSPSYPRRVS